MEKDVVQVLVEDHAVLGWLAARLRSATSWESRSSLFNEFARALGAHLTVIDQTVIPALKECGWRGLSSEVLMGHVTLKRRIAETLTQQHGSAAFEDALSALLKQLTAQLERERGSLLPLLFQSLDDQQRSVLAYEAEAHLTRILGDTPSPDEVDVAQPVNELLEEAHIVLGSLPRERTLSGSL